MKGIRLLTLVIACGFSASAIAAIAIPTGWYMEGNIGKSKSSGASYGSGLSASGTGNGWSINGGFKFIPFFAAEAGYTSYASATVKSGGTTVANDKTRYSYEIAGKAILPVYDSGFEVFAKLGLARLHNHVVATGTPSALSNGGTNTATGAYYGLGGDYSFTPNLAANFQWNRAKGNNSIGNLDLYSIGLTYIFG